MNISRFNKSPSKELLQAVAALERLSPAERDEAYAAIVGDQRGQETIEKYGKIVEKDVSWRRLLSEQWRNGDALPGDDHVRLHRAPKETGGLFTYISEPYGLGLAKLRAIVGMCDGEGLDLTVDSHSSHYPGACLRLVYKLAS